MDALNHAALLRTGFQDGSTQDLPISRTQIPEIMNFLKQAQQNLEAQIGARKTVAIARHQASRRSPAARGGSS